MEVTTITYEGGGGLRIREGGRCLRLPMRVCLLLPSMSWCLLGRGDGLPARGCVVKGV